MAATQTTVYKGDPSGKAKEHKLDRSAQLTGDQVLIKVTASGVCGTDLHYKQADMVLGHEGVGVVESTGPDCRLLKKGDRVGWGYEHDSCGHCHQCLTGVETHCPQRKVYGEADTDQGSFASHAVWKEAFLFPLPDGLADEDAAPLMCGGATVFNALRAYDTQPTDTVGVMGVGGLGHLAIQFAAKMGCRVVVLSGSDRKRDEALRLGAHDFVATKGRDDLAAAVPHKINRLLVTTSAQPDWAQLLPVLAPGAWVFPLSVAEGNFEIPYMPVILKGLTIQGSFVAARHIQKSMLDFAALHGIKPVTETFPMTEQGVNDAMDRLEKGQVHFRAVLKP